MDEDKNNMGTLPIFDTPTNNSIIKVIGVGGGGGNAVNYMYKEGIHDVSFVVCNTDKQVLDDSPIPVHVLLGHEGLGAGNNPAKGREAAEESIEDIRKMLDDGTRMTFITAGMGGGTGTGAAPIIARVSKEMDILTVGIVTIPFRWEGAQKINQALDGVEELAKYVDALLVISNERLLNVYPELPLYEGFNRADDTLKIAAKSIAEIITTRGFINLDFKDVRTVLKDGGIAIMSTGYGEGENRIKKAIDEALHSPLLNDNDIFNSKKILLNISFNGDPSNQNDTLKMEEMNDVNDFMKQFVQDYQSKWGLSNDPELGNKVKVTILATGFGIEDIDGMSDHQQRRLTQDEIAKKAKEDEEKARTAARMQRYYGGTDNNSEYRRRPRIFLFNNENLDNEDVIFAVENNPTYKRSKKTMDDIEHIANGNRANDEEPSKAEGGEGSNLISFA